MFRVCIALLISLSILGLPLEVLALTPLQTLVSLDKEIALKEAELMKMTARLQLGSANKHKYRKWIDFGGQEASAAGFLATSVVGTYEVGKNLDTPLRINRRNLARGLNAGITGSVIGASASASQLLLDAAQSLTKREEAPPAIRSRFFSELDELDRLLAEREKIVEGDVKLRSSALIDAESKLLNVLRDSACIDFFRTYSYVAEERTAQSVYYGFDISRNTTGAVGTGLLKRALDKPSLNSTGNALFIVSGAITIAAPWLSTAAGKLTRRLVERRLRRKLEFDDSLNVEKVVACRQQLRSALAAETDPEIKSTYPAVEIVDSLNRTHGSLEKRVLAGIKQKEKFRKTAFQQQYASAAIGGQFLALGIIGNTSWHQYGKRLRLRKWNRRLLAANILGISATGMAVGATAGSALAGEYAEFKGKKNKDRVQDILEERIRVLEDVKGEFLKIDASGSGN